MRVTRALQRGMVEVAIAVLLTSWPAPRPSAQPAQAGAVQIDNDDIGGVVTSKNGPEAGVWVIAEATDLGTRFAKIAVTDERGRYVIPDLPKVTYNVWVDRKSTRLNSSHLGISYAVFCLKKKNKTYHQCQ